MTVCADARPRCGMTCEVTFSGPGLWAADGIGEASMRGLGKIAATSAALAAVSVTWLDATSARGAGAASRGPGALEARLSPAAEDATCRTAWAGRTAGCSATTPDGRAVRTIGFGEFAPATAPVLARGPGSAALLR